MNLAPLSHLLARLDPLADATGGGEIAGLLSGAKPAVLGALATSTPAPVVLIMSHPADAAAFAQEVRHFTAREAVLFPAIESLPYERVRLDRSVLSARERVVQQLAEGEAPLIVAPVRALLQPVEAVTSQLFEQTTLQRGEAIQLDALLDRLVEQGYVDVTLVDLPGTFARRGGVLDIFPAGGELPVRIELFGREIESLRTFDPVTQRSVTPLEQISIPPMAGLASDARAEALEELLGVDTDSLSAEAQTRWLDDLARLEAGATFDEMSLFLPYLVRHPVSLLDILPVQSLVVIDTARETEQHVSDLSQQGIEVQRSLEEEGSLPVGLKPALLTPAQVEQALTGKRLLRWFTGSREGARDWSSLFLPPRLYAGRAQTFVHEMARQQQTRTLVVTQQHDRVEELLREGEVAVGQSPELGTVPERGVLVLPGLLREGWSLPGARLNLLTDHELFGRRPRSAPARAPKAAREAFLGSFQPGDYVVHLEHGVGRFEGVTRMEIDGAEREYGLVQYAGTDRVYVPTDQLERLTRYIGVGEGAPPLNKLGGGEWQRARQRAKQAADDMAQELVDLYSRRLARPGHAFGPDSPWQGELEAAFPFEETADQLRTVAEVKGDMEAGRPMDRLVCADVGYGKTEIAVRAAFKAVMDGRQVAVLAPTTILAQQHYETFTERFGGFPLRVEVLSRFRKPAEQREVLQRLAAGEVDVLIGTHRILQKDVHFKQLGLLIIDEEQRFGVKHKEQLKRLRETIDVLTLTATPIPRTLHMTLVGIREVSVIETPPEGRLPVKTYLEPYNDRLVREAILRELDRDGQVYVVHNRVSTIEAMAEQIRRLVPDARVLVGHGQMEEAELEKVMLAFAHHEADVLVCSTIIENGLDIPNVNTIIVNHAERLGLTQLYQLRGRVGRSDSQAYAYLLYPADAQLSHDALRRMEAVFETQDLGAGFTIAMKDLEIRGAGNLLGANQSGHAAAVGFDLYTRMVSSAVERLRGVPMEEPPTVTIDLPITMYLPADYIGNESERLTLYRRLAAVTSEEELAALVEELRDRFGPLPEPVRNLVSSITIKLLAGRARVSSISLGPEQLLIRGEPSVVYDRLSLHRRFGTEARISTTVLRIPRSALATDWMAQIRAVLEDMVRLRESIAQRQTVSA